MTRATQDTSGWNYGNSKKDELRKDRRDILELMTTRQFLNERTAGILLDRLIQSERRKAVEKVLPNERHTQDPDEPYDVEQAYDDGWNEAIRTIKSTALKQPNKEEG